MKYLLLFCLWMGTGCKFSDPAKPLDTATVSLMIPSDTLTQTDSGLALRNGVLFHQDTVFSGYVETYFANGRLNARQSFFQGKEEGWLDTWFPDGAKESRRYFHLGEKDSVHLGWWENGRLRFEYHFRNGLYEGGSSDWYAGGQPFKYIFYQNGKDQYGKGWRENGKLFMSYVVKEGRRYGLVNAQPCYTLEKEKGVYSSLPISKKSPL